MRQRRLLLSGLVAILVSACGYPNKAGLRGTIEAALKPFGVMSVPTGSRLNLDSGAVNFFKKLETEHLVMVAEVPQDNWGDFASRTFMEGAKPYSVSFTPKLIQAARNPEVNAKDDNYTFQIPVSIPEVGDIIRDEDYKGPLATPGESFRLVLATIRHQPDTTPPAPTSARVDQHTLAPSELQKLSALLPSRLRCVARYSDFQKEWTIVALDVGYSDPERWSSSSVR